MILICVGGDLMKLKSGQNYIVSGFTKNGEYFSNVLLKAVKCDKVVFFVDDFDTPYTFDFVKTSSSFEIEKTFSSKFDSRRDLYISKLEEVAKPFCKNIVVFESKIDSPTLPSRLKSICLEQTKNRLIEMTRRSIKDKATEEKTHYEVATYFAPYLILSAYIQNLLSGHGMEEMIAYDSENRQTAFFRYCCCEVSPFIDGVKIGNIDPVINENSFSKISSDGAQWFGTKRVIEEARARYNSIVLSKKSAEEIIENAYQESRRVLGFENTAEFRLSDEHEKE